MFDGIDYEADEKNMCRVGCESAGEMSGATTRAIMCCG